MNEKHSVMLGVPTLTGGDRESAVLRTFLNRRFRRVRVQRSRPNLHSNFIGIPGS